jgi:hypothetical protein
MTDTPRPPRVTARQIADLLAWARSLSEQHLDADPVERAAFLRTKIELLGRIAEDRHEASGGEA